MSYKELKDYINRTLGSSLKCVLPSYWWKKLLHYLVDHIEEIQNKLLLKIEDASEAYKQRCFIIDDVDDAGKESNAALYTQVLLGGLGNGPRKPVYVLSGWRLDTQYTCQPDYTIEFDSEHYRETGELRYIIILLDVPMEREGQFCDITIYPDGSFGMNKQNTIYYRIDGEELTEEQKKVNRASVDPFTGHLGFEQLYRYKLINFSGREVYPSLVSVGGWSRPEFYIWEKDTMVCVTIDKDSGDYTYRKIGAISPTYYLPKGVAYLTPDNNVYTFTEAEAKEWAQMKNGLNGFLRNECVMAPYKSSTLSYEYYKRCDMTQPVGAYSTYAADFISIDSATGKATVKRVRYDINSTGVTAYFEYEGTFDYTPTTTA